MLYTLARSSWYWYDPVRVSIPRLILAAHRLRRITFVKPGIGRGQISWKVALLRSQQNCGRMFMVMQCLYRSCFYTAGTYIHHTRPLHTSIAAVQRALEGHDLVIVIDAQVHRFNPFPPGKFLPEGSQQIQFTADQEFTTGFPVGDSLIGEFGLEIEQ